MYFKQVLLRQIGPESFISMSLKIINVFLYAFYSSNLKVIILSPWAIFHLHLWIFKQLSMDFIYIFDSTKKDKICNMQEPTIYREFGFQLFPSELVSPILKGLIDSNVYTTHSYWTSPSPQGCYSWGEVRKAYSWFREPKKFLPSSFLIIKKPAHHRSPKSPLRLPNLLYYSIRWLSKYHTVT